MFKDTPLSKISRNAIGWLTFWVPFYLLIVEDKQKFQNIDPIDMKATLAWRGTILYSCHTNIDGKLNSWSNQSKQRITKLIVENEYMKHQQVCKISKTNYSMPTWLRVLSKQKSSLRAFKPRVLSVIYIQWIINCRLRLESQYPQKLLK